MIIHSPVISGSLTFADGATFTMPDNGVYSGSFSGSFQGDGSSLTFGGTNIISSSNQLAEDFLDTLGDGVISGSAQVEFNEVNNNPFSQSASTVVVDKSIVPSLLSLDLGSPSAPFKDLYLSSASLYVDGTQVISSNTNELIITTDANQSLKLVETGADTVQIQTENGDITLTSSGTGNIELDAPIQIVAGNQIISSDGNAIQFGEDIDIDGDLNVQGNITLTGTVDGVDVLALSSSVAGLSTDYNDLINIPSGIVSSSAQVDALGFLQVNGDDVVSGSSQVVLESADKTGFTGASSITTLGTIGTGVWQGSIIASEYLDADPLPAGTISGSSQVILEDADKTGFTGAGSITTLGTVTTGDIKSIIRDGVVSGSVQIDHDSTTNFVSNEHIDHSSVSVTAGDGLTGGGDITQTRNLNVGAGDGISVAADAVAVDATVIRTSGGQSIGGTTTFQDISVNGTGSFAFIQSVTGSAKVIGDAYIILNADSPAEQYAGIRVYDSGSSDTGSLEYDSVNNHWFYESTTEGYASGLIAGPRDSRGAITFPSNNKVLKGIGGNHIDDSNITDDGTTITLGSNTTVSGNITVTGTVDGRDIATDGTKLDGIDDNANNYSHPTHPGDDIDIDTGALTGATVISDLDFNITTDTEGHVTDANASIATRNLTADNLGLGTSDTVRFSKIGVGVDADSTYELKVSGDIGATGDVVAYVSSDERLKKNIELISNPIQKVQALKGVTWVWKDEASDAAKASPNLGVIAQDVEKVLPQLVHDRENGYKGVDYSKMVGLLIEAVKDQQKQIDDLKSRLS